jgi:ribosome-associated protein
MVASGGQPGAPESVVVDFPITLGQFLKASGLAGTGGEAKQLIIAGLVRVNDVVDTRRGRKLAAGDVVAAGDAEAQAVAAAPAARTPGPEPPGR